MLEEAAASRAEEARRLLLLTAAAGLAYVALAARLFHLQIIHGGEMLRLAEQNRSQVVPLAAPRGRLIDRSGEPLIDNAPRFSLYYSDLAIPAEDSRRVEAELAAIFPDKADVVAKRLAEARKTDKMTRLLVDLPRDKALGLIERRVTMPGVHIVTEPQRRARFGPLAGHVLGYVDEITPAELKASTDENVRPGQFRGRMGIERQYDRLLRGQDGGIRFEMDARGRHLQALERIPAVAGSDVVLTLDRALQAAAERGLAATTTRRGAAVVLDPQTGAVLALASLPAFDPSAADMAALLKDPALPLFNRAIQGTYPLGSVFKAVTAVAALLDKWDIRRVILCPGVFRLGNKDFKCWKRHGPMNFMDAMAWSCDVYYYVMGLKAGVSGIEAVGRSMGLGEPTGVDLSSEAPGLMPGPAWKRRAQKQPWFDGDTVNMSIGQGYVLTTPLQAGLLMAVIANGGTVWRPQIVSRAVSPAGAEVYRAVPQARGRVELPAEIWGTLRESLYQVVRRGTGGGAFRPDLVIGGKTGTAQNPHGEDHAWFAAFAGPRGEPPAIAVAAFVENGGHGADAALPVVREIINQAFPPPPPTEARHG